jgi:hypothetical protein
MPTLQRRPAYHSATADLLEATAVHPATAPWACKQLQLLQLLLQFKLQFLHSANVAARMDRHTGINSPADSEISLAKPQRSPLQTSDKCISDITPGCIADPCAGQVDVMGHWTKRAAGEACSLDPVSLESYL